jgi:hypothetical protein
VIKVEGIMSPDMILVKFYFTNPKRIPLGIPLKEKKEVRGGLTIKDIRRGMVNYRSFQRLRQGKVDTGTHEEVKYVKLLQFIQEIEKAGYRLVDCHYFEQQTTFGKKKFTVVMGYSRLSTNGVQFSPETMKGVRGLLSIYWKICHLWQNPPENGKIVWTVNLMHLLPNTAPDAQIKSLSFKRWLNARG